MQKLFLSIFICISIPCAAQHNTVVREYKKVFTTYPFSDPDPVPDPGSKFYPYFRYDGFTDKAIKKEWKVVELENDFLKIMILPEIGGKIWSAVEKSTGKSFIYYNHVIKFRDIAMRGPWTSGGIEANYGIIGHTPACATPVDYTIVNKDDGSISCVIGVLDLLTRTPWRLEINLPKDKAYITTTSFWFNASGKEQPYYTWMNTGIKAKGNLQYIYPGTDFLGHEGEHGDWPVNKKNGKDVSWYENNNFGGYKSYHVFGKYTDFFGAYWHDDDFGMGRFSPHDEKPGKKIWIWGLSQQGMIWEKLLTDTDGQYTEVQSGRLFNQTADKSTFTPFKHRSFAAYSADTWTEYWFPVNHTKGFVKANNYGALNIRTENGFLKINFSPLQKIDDTLKITNGKKIIYVNKIQLSPMQTYADSIAFNTTDDGLTVTLGENKMSWNSLPDIDNLSRPLNSPTDMDWESVQGLYLQGKENIDERNYADAEIKMQQCLQKDNNYLPALSSMAMLQYNKLEYSKALYFAKKALSIDTYDPAANYYYGLVNVKLNNITDAKDGFDIASQNISFRDAAYVELSKLYLRQHDLHNAAFYAEKSLLTNSLNIDALRLLAVSYRLQNKKEEALAVLSKLASLDALNHFTWLEYFLWDKNESSKNKFTNLISDELPEQTYLELAIWYYNIADINTALTILKMSPQTAEIMYWVHFLSDDKTNTAVSLSDGVPVFLFPFREETLDALRGLPDNDWRAKYYDGLIYWGKNNIDKAKEIFTSCAEMPSDAAFYASRAKLFESDSARVYKDILHAVQINEKEWRYGKMLVNYFLKYGNAANAIETAKKYAERFPQNYIIGMLYVKALQQGKQYAHSSLLIDKINILPYEGSTEGRNLYKEAHLQMAVQQMKNAHYKNALKEIEKAKLWPQNLGVGKPYDDQVDERLEDWLSYQCYTALGNNAAMQENLQKIFSFVPKRENTVSNFSETNSLINAWALEGAGKKEEAKKYLTDKLQQDPGNEILKWCIDIFNGNIHPLSANTKGDENYRVLYNYLLEKK